MPSDDEKADAREDRLQGPMRALHKEREYVRKQMLKDSRDSCDESRAAYVECAKGARRARARRATKKKKAHSSNACSEFIMGCSSVAGRTISLPFMCRTLFKEFNTCLND